MADEMNTQQHCGPTSLEGCTKVQIETESEILARNATPKVIGDIVMGNPKLSFMGQLLRWERAFEQAFGFTNPQKRRMDTKTYYTIENCCNNGAENLISFQVEVPGDVDVIADDTAVLRVIGAYGNNGRDSLPIKGHRAYVNISGRGMDVSNVDIIDKNKDVNFGHLVTIRTINGEKLTFKAGKKYRFLYQPTMIDDKECITPDPSNRQYTFSRLKPQYIETYSTTECLTLDDLRANFRPSDAMNVPSLFKMVKDPFTDKIIDVFNPVSEITRRWDEKRYLGDMWRLLFNKRNEVDGTEFDGLFTSVYKRYRQKFTISNDKNVVIAALTSIANKVRADQKTNTVTIIMDLEMSLKIDDALRQFQDYKTCCSDFNFYGTTIGEIEWFGYSKITNWKKTGINFIFQTVDVDVLAPFNAIVKDFGIVIPMEKSIDQNGNYVAPFRQTELVDKFTMNLNGVSSSQYTNTPVWNIDDTAVKTGCKKLNIWARWSQGLETNGCHSWYLFEGTQSCC